MSSSIISSIVSFSTHSTRSVAPARAGLFSWQAVMDSLLAIATGLALRAFVSVAINVDTRAASTLIGLWEGIVLMHFLKKMPRSYDPYVAYGARLFVDFLVTESLYRLMVVLLWTGVGMVMADIAPVFWYDMGVRKMWHRFRRDLYILSRSFPSLLSFTAKPRSSRVRFHERTRSASRGYAPTESIVTGTSMPSATRSTTTSTTSRTSTSTATPVIPTLRPQTPARPRKLPGSFPGYSSEIDTDVNSVSRLPPLPPSNRSVSAPSISDNGSDALATPRIGPSHSNFRLHEPSPASNMSSSSSTLSDDTEVPESQPVNPADLPDIDLIQQETAPVQQIVKKDETPKPPPIVLPPTPADTLRDVDLHRSNDPREVPPPSATMPVIPDQNEWNVNEGWETIDPSEAPPILLQDEPLDRKGKGKQKSLPPPPEDIEIRMPVPHPAPAPILPVPEFHSDEIRPDSPPPSFEDVYGPDANEVPLPVDTKAGSLIDFDGNGDEDAGQGDPGGDNTPAGIEQNPPPDEHPPEDTHELIDTAQEEHPDDVAALQPLDQSGTRDLDAELQDNVGADPDADDSLNIPPPSPSPPPSPTPSSVPPLDERIPEAFTLREHVMTLSQQLKHFQQEQAQAGNDGDKAGAIAHKVEVEKTKRELERAKKRLARRIFADNNATASTEIALAGIFPEDAVILVEETLEKLLLDLDHDYKELTVLFPPAKKAGALALKQHVVSALEDHQIKHNFDLKNARKLIIQFPSEPDDTQ